ncbi:MAG TPA: hypothetical protein VFY46_02705 [Acidimicrobiia bacterium]|nr:hypothetical protein [Acidimicrobiia bacterium]
MSEYLAAAAQALSAPEAIVKRSAEARAKAGGMSVDEVLAAWAGGVTVAATSTPPVSPPPAAAAPAVETEPAPVSAPVVSAPVVAQAPAAPKKVEEVVPPASLRSRVKLAGRIGAMTGAVLGLAGALLASPWLLPGASVIGEEGSFSPAFEVNTRLFLLGSALLSMVFGLIVASLARTIPGWIDPGMALGGSARNSGLVGIGTGLVLGLVGGGVVTAAFGVPIEGVEGRVVVPVLSALVLGLVGGAALGWLTAAFAQAVSMPSSVPESASEVAQVKSRLSAAISVPLAGLLALVLLVVPFAVVLIRSNHMTSGGAAIIAILAAVSILAIAGLSASSPGMKISRGEFLLALTGIGVVLTIIVAVMLAQSEPHEDEAVEAAEARVVVVNL